MHEGPLASLLEGTADAAFTVDAQGEIRTWNKAAEKLFGYPASLAVGKACAALVRGRMSGGMSVCCESCDILECVRAGREISNFDMEVRTCTTQRVWVNVSVLVAANERTQRRLVVHFMRDIRTRKKAEKLTGEVLRLAKSLVSSPDETGGLPPIAPLTVQEKTILSLLAAGKTTKEVAGQLQISASTLRNHISNLNQKLHTRSRLEAVMQAQKRGII